MSTHITSESVSSKARLDDLALLGEAFLKAEKKRAVPVTTKKPEVGIRANTGKKTRKGTSSNGDGRLPGRSMLPQHHVHPAATSQESAPSRTTATCMPSIIRLENNNCTDNLEFLPGECEKEASLEQQDGSPSPVQVNPEPPRIKEEQEEVLLGPAEAVKSEDDDAYTETEPLAGTSTERMKTQAYIEHWVPSQPASGEQLLTSRCSESDTDDWETRDDESVLNALESHKTQHVEGQSVSPNGKLSHNLKSSKRKPSTSRRTGKKSCICTVCGKVCRKNCELKNHMRIHTKPFACAVCDKSFNLSEHLTRHMCLHTREKPYECTVCSKSFRRNNGLKKHMIIHTDEKPFACAVCNRSFNLSDHLKTHMRIHTAERPFTCTVCSKSFNQKTNLTTHMRIHTGEKPFACTVCNKSFKHIQNVKTHMRIHTGERPFACTVCDKGFNQSSHLKTHMRIHSEEKPFT